MIASDGRVDLRGATKVGHPDHQGRIQEALLLEIDQQSREGLVDLGHAMLFQAVEAVLMVIPTRIADGDESHTGLDQTASEQ